jgi:hypothetical protein
MNIYTEDLDVERTGSAIWFSNKKQLHNGNLVQTFVQPNVREEFDLDLAGKDLDFSVTPSRGSHFEEEDKDHDDYMLTHDDYMPTDSTYTPSNDDDASNTSPRQNSFSTFVPSVIDTSNNHRKSRFPT